MNKLKIILSVVSAVILMNCERTVQIEAGVLWSDDEHFSKQGDWYLAISEGCYSNCEGATLCVADQLPISPGDRSSYFFDLCSGSEGNVTAFIYLDLNENAVFDDGYDLITGYKFNYASCDEPTPISVSAYY